MAKIDSWQEMAMTYITARLTLFTGLGLLFRRLFFEFVLHYLKKILNSHYGFLLWKAGKTNGVFIKSHYGSRASFLMSKTRTQASDALHCHAGFPVQAWMQCTPNLLTKKLLLKKPRKRINESEL